MERKDASRLELKKKNMRTNLAAKEVMKKQYIITLLEIQAKLISELQHAVTNGNGRKLIRLSIYCSH